MIRKLILASMIAVCLFASIGAHASIIGSTMRAQLGIDSTDGIGLAPTFFLQLSSSNFTAVEPGVSLSGFFGSIWTITSTQIGVTFGSGHSTLPFNGFRLVDILGTAPDFSTVTFVSGSGGMTAADIAFNNDIIAIDMSGKSSASVVLNYTTSVPAPAPMILLLGGLAGLVARSRLA